MPLEARRSDYSNPKGHIRHSLVTAAALRKAIAACHDFLMAEIAPKKADLDIVLR
jgi:hypothetical protein